jgi:DNA replicative helicase MCM subunit Mcm2 (Cdc46/Mcm family)
MMDDMIDVVRPGDHVVITGMLKPVRERMPGASRSRVFASEIECNFAEIREKDIESTQLSKFDEEKIKEVASRQDIYGQLIS